MGLARPGGVLSIGRVLAGEERERYYLEQVGQGREDYYAGEGEEGGVWLGIGAGSLDARGSVNEDGLTASCAASCARAVCRRST
jgi:hypothetical protein